MLIGLIAVLLTLGSLTAPGHADRATLAAGDLQGEIHDLVAQGDLEAVRDLLTEDPTLLESRDGLGHTPLHTAAIEENPAIVRFLLEAGAEVDARNDRQRTAIWLAAWQNDGVEVVSLLLAHGADIEAVGFLGQTPLSAAIVGRRHVVVDVLLDQGASLPTETSPRIELMYRAVTHGNLRVFERMFEVLPTLDPASEEAADLLWGAAEGGSGAIMERLLATGIDPDSPDAYQDRPIHTTSQSGFTEATLALIGRGADLNRRNLTGDSPYNLAVAYEHTELAARLTELGADSGPPEPPVLQGDYLGETLPGGEPVVFAPGIVSREGSQSVHATTVFSRDGSEVYWSDAWQAPISYMKRVDGRWTMPAHVPFTTGYIDDIPMFSPDEKRLYFLSSMPIDGGEASNREYLWYVERESPEDPWSEPIPGPAAINAVPLHWQFAIAPNGDFYLPAATVGGQGRDIYVSRLVDGEYQSVERIEGPLNTSGDEHMPFIAPDESYMLFAARNRPGTDEHFRLYVSFRGSDGSFQEPELLPERITGGWDQICPVVTPDGQYLFYISGNDVRWVSTEFVEGLR